MSISFLEIIGGGGAKNNSVGSFIKIYTKTHIALYFMLTHRAHVLKRAATSSCCFIQNDHLKKFFKTNSDQNIHENAPNCTF